jgi:hypothetical protein
MTAVRHSRLRSRKAKIGESKPDVAPVCAHAPKPEMRLMAADMQIGAESAAAAFGTLVDYSANTLGPRARFW